MVRMDLHKEAEDITRIKGIEEIIIKITSNANFIVGLTVPVTPAGIAKIQLKATNQVRRSAIAWGATIMVASQNQEDSNSTTHPIINPITIITLMQRTKITKTDY